MKEMQQIDVIIKCIRTVTLLIVAVYMVWSYSLIRKIYQSPAISKTGYSITTNHRDQGVDVEIALHPAH